MHQQVKLMKPGRFIRLPGTTKYWKIISMDDEGVTLKLFDTPYAEKEKVSYSDAHGRAIRGHVFQRVGMYNFEAADNPAADEIAFCHRCPELAGQMLYELKLQVGKYCGAG